MITQDTVQLFFMLNSLIRLHEDQLLLKQIYNITLQFLCIDRFRSIRIETTIQDAFLIFCIDISRYCHDRNSRRYFTYDLRSLVASFLGILISINIK